MMCVLYEMFILLLIRKLLFDFKLMNYLFKMRLKVYKSIMFIFFKNGVFIKYLFVMYVVFLIFK